MDLRMLKTSHRVTGIFQRKNIRIGRQIMNLSGYNRWVEYVEAYRRYLDTDLEAQRLAAYSHWIDNSHSLLIPTYEIDLPHLSNHAPRKVGQAAQYKPQPQPQLAEAPAHLYALEVDDLLDFTEADIFAAWDLRAQTCGSREAAAELYALYRVLAGIDDVYAGPTAYLEHSNVVAVLGASEELAKPQPPSGFNLFAIRKMSLAELKLAWANRPDSFASLEAAAEALATLRTANTKELGTTNYRHLMTHALIKDLEDLLPMEGASAHAPPPAVELRLLSEDRRTVRIQSSVVRQGQGNFRAAMLERYGAQCVITGCRIDTLLEAAHIIPYRGDQSHDELNGLLLRVDIHRLFDAHQISINPETLTVELAHRLNDEAYLHLQGKRLFLFSPKPRALYLEAHHNRFIAISKNPPLTQQPEVPRIF